MATPFKVSGLLPAWTELGLLKAQKAQLAGQLEAYDELQAKLERVPDLSQAHVMVPKAALVQATSTKPSSSAPQAVTPTAAPGASASGDGAAGGESDKVRITAQEAYDLTKSAQTAIRAKLAEVEAGIGRASQTAKGETTEQAGLDKDWTINEDGEVMNEEGLPMFDIHEELPPLQEQPKIQEIKPAPVEEAAQPRTRYLIKKGGKQTFGSVKPAPAPLSKDFKMSASAAALLDELEKEEEEEARQMAAEEDGKAAAPSEGGAEEAEVEGEKAAPTAAEKGKGKAVDSASPTTPTATITAIPTAPAPAATTAGDARAPPKKAPAGFAAGFLNKKTKAKLAGQATKPAVSSPLAQYADAPTPTQPAAPAPPTPATVPTPAPASTTDSPPTSPHHEPLHHILPPPTPIYKPTPPPSEPASRAASPKPPRKSVAFDPSIPDQPQPKSPKPKRAPIILPAPPGMDGAEEQPSVPKPAPAKFERPIKETIVEREVKPPSAPKPRDNLTSGGAGGAEKKAARGKDKILNTMGFAPRAEGQAPRGQIIERSTRPPEPMPSAAASAGPSAPASNSTAEASTGRPSAAEQLAAGPIHTLSLSAAAAANPFSEKGTMSVYDIDDDEEDDDDDDDDEDEDEDSDAFYGSDSDESVDIDAALHAREIALEYHRQHMNVGAGAGTGPLGGFADPESFDSWNQPEVPLDATLQGREPSHGGASRFRTGRLESTQMIIPSLLQDQVVTSLDGEKEDDMTGEERERLKKALEALASHEGGGRVELLEETKRRAMEDALAREAERKRVPEVQPASRRPPEIKAAAKPAPTAISVPSNFGAGASAPKAPEPEAEAAPSAAAPTPPAAPGAAPGKKMSRFKARQLGLDV